jgi:hypothetical protein
VSQDEPVTADAIAWAAQRTMAMHTPPFRPNAGTPGRCASCTDTGCPQLAWAATVLTSAALARPRR